MAVNHFKEFGTVAEYEAYIQPDDYAKPLVALVDETQTVMFPQGGGGGDCGNPILTSVDVDDYSGGAEFGAISQITDVEFPSGITSLKVNCFDSASSLTNVTLPSTLTEIGQSAFQFCSALTSIDLSGTSVTEISQSAFDGCSSLTSVAFPSTLTSILNYSFKSSGLHSVDIPSGVTTIGQSAFYGCSMLSSVTVRATTPPTTYANTFNGTHANMVIYVPAESVETYKAASGWSNFASKIQAIP